MNPMAKVRRTGACSVPAPLIAALAAAAARMADRPFRALALAVLLTVPEIRAGHATAYAVPRQPPRFSTLAVATAVWAATFLVRRPSRRVRTDRVSSDAADVAA